MIEPQTLFPHCPCIILKWCPLAPLGSLWPLFFNSPHGVDYGSTIKSCHSQYGDSLKQKEGCSEGLLCPALVGSSLRSERDRRQLPLGAETPRYHCGIWNMCYYLCCMNDPCSRPSRTPQDNPSMPAQARIRFLEQIATCGKGNLHRNSPVVSPLHEAFFREYRGKRRPCLTWGCRPAKVQIRTQEP